MHQKSHGSASTSEQADTQRRFRRIRSLPDPAGSKPWLQYWSPLYGRNGCKATARNNNNESATQYRCTIPLFHSSLVIGTHPGVTVVIDSDAVAVLLYLMVCERDEDVSPGQLSPMILPRRSGVRTKPILQAMGVNSLCMHTCPRGHCTHIPHAVLLTGIQLGRQLPTAESNLPVRAKRFG